MPGELHAQRSLAGCSPWSCRESDTIVQACTTTLPDVSLGAGAGNAQAGRTPPISSHAPPRAAVLEAKRGIITAVPLHRWVTRGCHLSLMGQREEWTCLKSHSAVCMHELILDGASEPSCKGFRMKETELPFTPMTQASPLSDRLGKTRSQTREAQNPRRYDHSWLRGPISGVSTWALNGHNLLCGLVTLLVLRHLP